MNWVIGFLAGLGVAAWLYAKQMRSTGGNAKSSLIGAAIAGAIVFIVVWTVAAMVDSSLN